MRHAFMRGSALPPSPVPTRLISLLLIQSTTYRLHVSCSSYSMKLMCNPEVAFMEDRIEKQIEIAAPISRVWQALTDSRQFGEWFLVKMERPFVAGQAAAGQITHPRYE